MKRQAGLRLAWLGLRLAWLGLRLAWLGLRLAWLGPRLACLLCCHPAAAAAAPLVAPDRASTGGFLVAFELSPRRGFALVWPHESLPAFPEPRVVLVVESMPRVSGPDGSRALAGAEGLRVNGRTPRRRRAGPGPAPAFLVDLAGGRLHVALVLPAGARFEPDHDAARITLYRADSTGGARRFSATPSGHFAGGGPSVGPRGRADPRPFKEEVASCRSRGIQAAPAGRQEHGSRCSSRSWPLHSRRTPPTPGTSSFAWTRSG